MGLDITAYRGLTKAQPGEGIDPTYPEESDYDNGWVRMYVNTDFSGRNDSIEDRAIYKPADQFGFRAGSYSGYSVWRNQLAEMAGYSTAVVAGDRYAELYPAARGVHLDPQPGPFVELINFSDCEGVIGPETSAKLAQDFAAFQEKADAHPDDWFRDRYALWRKAFEMASDNGAVAFH
jgi:hypothetical protein